MLQIARSLQAQNGWHKQLFFAMITMLILMLAGIVGLATALNKAVNTTTTKLDVNDASSLVTVNMESGENSLVATDTYAHVHYIPYVEGAGYCATQDDVLAVQDEVLSGKLVIMEYKESEDAPLKVVQFVASGSTIINEDGEACFQTLEGKEVCISESEECKAVDEEHRSLQHIWHRGCPGCGYRFVYNFWW